MSLYPHKWKDFHHKMGFLVWWEVVALKRQIVLHSELTRFLKEVPTYIYILCSLILRHLGHIAIKLKPHPRLVWRWGQGRGAVMGRP